MKKRIKINRDYDYIKVGYCNVCRNKNRSIIVHHPLTGGRSYAICNYCNKEAWNAVGESNKDNFLKYGSVTKQRKNYNRKYRKPQDKK